MDGTQCLRRTSLSPLQCDEHPGVEREGHAARPRRLIGGGPRRPPPPAPALRGAAPRAAIRPRPGRSRRRRAAGYRTSRRTPPLRQASPRVRRTRRGGQRHYRCDAGWRAPSGSSASSRRGRSWWSWSYQVAYWQCST
jgi:hypothetical protein